ncbi:MAG: LLM class flavin-dependent oxidoreductase [Actinomycetia bacterium]|nr:LLM class flavin-dependent oxidoreductase [Actinomycetes bacterium]
MTRLKFGAFVAPHHPPDEHPSLQYQRDLELVEQLDRLGFDEFWCGEHHSTGWEMIASPEMFLAAAGARTHRIKLGTGVVSLPYHHPFHVAQRIVQLDYMTQGRAILGTGPGALPSDAHMLGIDPMVLRDRQDEAIGVIRRLLAGERVTYEGDWFSMYDAKLHVRPLQEELPQAVASMVSPSGMTLAGKYGMGILSIGSVTTAGVAALPLQWSFAEEAAQEAGTSVDRRDWRIVLNFHIAETRQEAKEQAKHGLLRWHNEYTVGTLQRAGVDAFDNADEAVEKTAYVEGSAAVIGTPDDLVQRIREINEVSGGFGTVIGFVHDWTSPENNARSWDLVARHVIPEVNGLLDDYRQSREFVVEHREYFERAGQAIMSKIMENDRAKAALKEQANGAPAIHPHSSHVPEDELTQPVPTGGE